MITDPAMRKKFERMLRDSGDLYTLEDILDLIEQGKMQSFVDGDTWVVTQVHEFPRRKVLDIVFVVGHLGQAVQLLPQLYMFANEIGATLITGYGRDGWDAVKQPGWKKVGSLYAKELNDGA